MKSRRGCGNCTSATSVDGLVALTILFRSSRRALDVRRQRCLADFIEDLIERVITLKPQNASPARRQIADLAAQVRITESDTCSGLQARARPDHRFPNQRLDLSHQQNF